MLGEGLDGGVGREVEFPDIDDGAGFVQAGFDVGFGLVSLVKIADGQDDFVGVEADEVAGCFETEAVAGAGDDDGLAGEELRGDSRSSKPSGYYGQSVERGHFQSK